MNLNPNTVSILNLMKNLLTSLQSQKINSIQWYWPFFNWTKFGQCKSLNWFLQNEIQHKCVWPLSVYISILNLKLC